MMPETAIDHYRETNILGLVDRELDEAAYHFWGQALGSFLPERSRFVVSSDFRPSSPAYRQALINGLLESGVRVIDIGRRPTDLTSFACGSLGADGFASVTGGPYLPEWNGLRWMICDQSDSHARQKRILESRQISFLCRDFDADRPIGACRVWDPTYEWISWLQEVWFDTPSVPIRIVVDPMFGNWAELATSAFRAVFPGFDFHGIRNRHDAKFGGCSPSVRVRQSLRPLRTKVKSLDADLGVALEADAGLFCLIDDQGSPISHDELCWLFLQMIGHSLDKEIFLLDEGVSSRNVEEGKRYGGTPKIVPGNEESFVAEMKRNEALIGFGSKGEIYYRGAQGNRIVIFAICWVLDYLAHLRCPLSSWRTQFSKDFFR